MVADRKVTFLLVMVAAVAAALQTSASNAQKRQPLPGYTDTPVLPGGRWHVHDSGRPQPRAIEPGTPCAQEAPLGRPSDAMALFDGSGLDRWRTSEGEAPAWMVADGVLQVPPTSTPRGGDIYTRDEFGDCQLHIEWATPDPPQGNIMNRGNSGVFFCGLYELQIFDSYRGGIYADGQAAAIYGQYPPLVNSSRPPGAWQAFDVLFTAPRFKDDVLQAPAYMTVFHNGVAVHNHVALLGATGHRILPKYAVHGLRGPLMLQAHGNPVRFRNIWIRPLGDYDQP